MNMTKLYTTWMILADLRLKFPFVPSIGEWKEELKEGKYALIMFNHDIKKKKVTCVEFAYWFVSGFRWERV